MGAEAFNPDKYIAEKAKATVQSNSFDPDKYLAEKSGQDQGYDFAGAPGRILQGASTAARSGLQTMTMGASEPLLSGMNALSRTARGDDYSLDALKKNYDADVAQRRQDKANMPVSDIGGGLLGAFSPVGPAAAVGSKVSGLVEKGAQAVLPEWQAAQGSGKMVQGLSNLYGNASNVATGAAQGAAGALAQVAPQQVIEGSTGFIKKGDKNVPSLGDTAAYGAKFGAAVPAAMALAKGAGEAGGYAGKKLMSSFLGPSEEHIDYYMKHPEAVNGAKSIEELKDKVDGITDKLREDVVNGDKSVADAKSDLRDVEQAVAEHRRQSNFDFSVTSTEVKQQFRQAKLDLDKAFEGKKRTLENVKAPTDLADEANQAVRDLKDKVVSGSKEAKDLLSSQDRNIELFSPYKALKSARDKLNIAGTAPATPQAKAAQASIDGLMSSFGAIPGGKLSESDAKHLIQQIDQSEQVVYKSGEFTDDVSRAYKTLRQELDSQLKAGNKPYETAMKPVAENTGLHSDVVGPFGDRQAAISNLNRIASPTSTVNRENLSKLGKATGRDFDTPVQNYTKAQGILNSPEAMDKIKSSLPESKTHAELEALDKSMQGPAAKAEYVQKNLEGSGLLEQQKAKEGLLTQKQGLLDQKKGMLEPFKNLTPNSSESKLKTASRARPGEQVELTRQLEDLSKMSDTDFVKAVKDLRTKNAFNGQDTNGSRKVNLFGAIFGAAGAVITHGLVGTGAGAAIGTTTGALADKYGPKVSKAILDGVIKLGKSPTLAKIQALQIPPAAKAYLAKELADYNESEK